MQEAVKRNFILQQGFEEPAAAACPRQYSALHFQPRTCGVGVTINPYIEYYADNLPERRLGVFGIGLILCGFALQSLQYWLALFDVRLT